MPESYDVVREKAGQLPSETDSAFWIRQPTVRAFSNNPQLGETHAIANTTLWTETGLSAAGMECIVLTVARELDSRYVWRDHAIAAVDRAGLSESAVRTISDDEFDRLIPNRRLLIEDTAEYVTERGTVTAETHERLDAAYDEATVVSIVMLAGFYVSLCHEVEALSLEFRESFVGWQLENYPPPSRRAIPFNDGKSDAAGGIVSGETVRDHRATQQVLADNNPSAYFDDHRGAIRAGQRPSSSTLMKAWYSRVGLPRNPLVMNFLPISQRDTVAGFAPTTPLLFRIG